MGFSLSSFFHLSSSYTLLSIFSISFIFWLLSIHHKKNSTRRTTNLPPGPRTFPLIGNLHHLLGELPHRALQHLSRIHGPLMFLKLGSVPTLVISSADIAREVFKNHDRIFSGRPVLYAAEKITYGCSDVAFAPYGDYWREVRKIAILELFSLKRLQFFEAVRGEEVMLMVDSIAAQVSTALTSSRCEIPATNLSELTLLLANNVICRLAFGKKYDGLSFIDLVRETQDLLGGFCIADFFPWMGWFNKFNGLEKRLERNFNELDILYDKVIEEHKLDHSNRLEDVDRKDEDLVDVLLRVQKDSNQTNQTIALNNKQIKGVLTDMFIAGTDTSAASLVWIMTELVRNPSVMKRAQEEVRSVVKEKGKVEQNDLSQLVYLKLVVKEALRLHPPAPLLVPRETTETCTINGYNIPAKTRVFINAQSLATDPNCWKNPNEFWPERFLDCPIDFKGQHFEFLPFGAGRRGCPALNFAVLIIELALANLIYKFDWKLPNGMSIEDLDMEEAFGITMHKKTSLCLVATTPLQNGHGCIDEIH